MLKHLAILGGGVLMIAAILAAAYYQQRNAVGGGYDLKCIQPSEPSPTSSSLTCKIYPSQDTEKGHPSPQWWNVLIAWPEGVTAWLLLLTLAVITWQAWETRKAAENAGRALVFQQETLRPRVKINQFVNDILHQAVVEQDWVIVEMKISNSGGLPAYGVIADTWIEFVWGTPPYKFSSGAKYARADLRLNVHAGDPTGFELPLGRKLTDQERYAMGHGGGTVCFRVKLTYQALAREVHTDEAWSVGLGGMRSIAEYSSET
jgi:hypothetical protein